MNFDVLSSQLRNRLCAYSRKNTYTITANGRILLCPQLNKTVFGSIDNGVLNLNHYRLAKWYSLSSEKAVRCRNCSEYNICKGKTCISNLLALDNNIISEDLPECGREYKDLSNILKLLYKSNKELFIEY